MGKTAFPYRYGRSIGRRTLNALAAQASASRQDAFFRDNPARAAVKMPGPAARHQGPAARKRGRAPAPGRNPSPVMASRHP
ncbi:hypothetical protein DESPIGER_0122 [Desulfovibrio piger]|uniref:Uncharacterized protein n=1 Tax=Desulfovibrio piger TaxID=901 RepID=A0A1K1LBE6_9BACT|nr:hypothetical protein DESPIGER_0122 [Desulfovibrio piger]